MGNRASARVMEKCGMVREGTLRGWYWNEGAQDWEDVALYAALQEDAAASAPCTPQR